MAIKHPIDGTTVACYRFNETTSSADAVDASGNGHTAQAFGDPLVKTGKFDGARTLTTGSSPYVYFSANGGNVAEWNATDFTWVAWIKPVTPWTSGGDIVAKYGFGQPESWRIQAFQSVGNWRIVASAGLWDGTIVTTEVVSVSVSNVITGGIWQHIGVTWTQADSTLRVYHNCELKGQSTAINGDLYISYNNSYYPRIGIKQGGPLGTFDGDIDDLTYYNEAKPASFMTTYGCGAPPSVCSYPLIGGDFQLNHYKCLWKQHTFNDSSITAKMVPFSLGPPGLNLRCNPNPYSGSIG